MYRTHNCNELRIGNIGEEVTIAGFVSKIRNYLCRSEERRVGKECRSRWSPYH